MKNSLFTISALFVLMFLGFVACNTKTNPEHEIKYGGSGAFGVRVVKVDGCEYIIWEGDRAGSMVHKANCKNHKGYE